MIIRETQTPESSRTHAETCRLIRKDAVCMASRGTIVLTSRGWLNRGLCKAPQVNQPTHRSSFRLNGKEKNQR